MKVSTEIDNNFGYEKITQLVDNIPLITYTYNKLYVMTLCTIRVYQYNTQYKISSHNEIKRLTTYIFN
jgi:hypothetical protein